VRYDIRQISLQFIEGVLTDLGFHLSSKLSFQLMRALYYYTEEVQRANLGLAANCRECVQVFVQSYQRRRHGCQDRRPEHWRNYL
jgi:hypothetical protein